MASRVDHNSDNVSCVHHAIDNVSYSPTGPNLLKTITPRRGKHRGGDATFVARRTNAQRAAVQFFECSGQWIVARCVCGAPRGGVGVAHAHQASTAVRLKCVQLSHTLCVRPPFCAPLPGEGPTTGYSTVAKFDYPRHNPRPGYVVATGTSWQLHAGAIRGALRLTQYQARHASTQRTHRARASGCAGTFTSGGGATRARPHDRVRGVWTSDAVPAQSDRGLLPQWYAAGPRF